MSEYPLRDEGVQVSFKEGESTASKDRQSSFLSRKKAMQALSKRPETEVKSGNSNEFKAVEERLEHMLNLLTSP